MRKILIIALICTALTGCGNTATAVHEENTSSSSLVWNEQYEYSGKLASIFALDANHVYATGTKGYGTDSSESDVLFFNGSTWKTMRTGDGSFRCVSALNENRVWVGGNGIDFFNGSSWTTQLPDVLIENLFAYDSNHVWAVGGDVFQGDSIYFFNGSSWTKQDVTTSTEESFTQIYASDPSHVWAAGDNSGSAHAGITYFFDGSKWEMQYQTETNTTVHMLGISGVDSNHVWAAGSDFYFFNGKSWSPQWPLKDKEVAYDVTCFDSKHVWGCGTSLTNRKYGGIFFYDGSSWKTQYEANELVSKISCADKDHVWAIGSSVIYEGKE